MKKALLIALAAAACIAVIFYAAVLITAWI